MAITIYDGTEQVHGFVEFSRYLNYANTDPDSILMRPISSAIIRIQSQEGTDADWQLLKDNNIIFPEWESQKGPCQSKPIICYIKESDGLVVMGSNGTNNLRQHCIRYVLQNDPDNRYSDCEVVCSQPAHAEIMSLINYLLYKGIIVYEDIEQLFPETTSDNKISFGKIHHDYFETLLKQKGVNLKGIVEVLLYGQEICCDKCAKLLLTAGIDTVTRAPETHQDVIERRNVRHADINLNDIQVMQSETSVPFEG